MGQVSNQRKKNRTHILCKVSIVDKFCVAQTKDSHTVLIINSSIILLCLELTSFKKKTNIRLINDQCVRTSKELAVQFSSLKLVIVL